MATKRSSLSNVPLASKQPLLEVTLKKKKKKPKGQPKVHAARAILEAYGLCPISMQPMRRPVLPSSGQAFDEINIVRYCSTGNRRCPVSGANLKFNKGKVVHTIDFALRNLIRSQAAHAKVLLPSTDKETLFRELRSGCSPDAAKAVVDDCYLGHVAFAELNDLLAEFSSGRREEGGDGAAVFCALLAECLACRRADLASLAVDYLEVYESAWNDSRVLNEALAVAQDPDCRGQVLVVLEERIRGKKYDAAHLRALLGFETESVPVQQFQARVAQTVIQHGVKRALPVGDGFEAALNLALRVREDLEGCMEGDSDIDNLWAGVLVALRALKSPIDDATLERLFWRENRMVLQYLASRHDELLAWHLGQHKQAISLCISAIAGRNLSSDLEMDDVLYSSSEEYMSDEDDSRAPYGEVPPPPGPAFRSGGSRTVGVGSGPVFRGAAGSRLV